MLVCLVGSAGVGSSSSAGTPSVGWSEDFADDPVVAGRFEIPAGHDADRFEYDSGNQRLTVLYDTFLPTAWYIRPLDAKGELVLGPCDDFSFEVTFHIRSAGFFADPNQFAQIGWGLINTETTGNDRAGGEGPDFAYDVVGFDYFPNVSPFFGGPTLASTVIHSDTGTGYFASIEFPFGAESDMTAANGDEQVQLDTTYTGIVYYDAATRTATLRVVHDGVPLEINRDGGGGFGGPDGDPATIQTTLFADTPFTVNAFALTCWQDTFNPFDASVIADVDVLEIVFHAVPGQPGDVNLDGEINGVDVQPFIETLLGDLTDECAVRRADMNVDEDVTEDDIEGFVQALLAE